MVFCITKNNIDQLSFISPNFSELIINFFWGHVFLLVSLWLAFVFIMHSWLALWNGVTRFFAFLWGFLFFICFLFIYQKYFVGAFFFYSFAFFLAIGIGTLVLGKSIKKLKKFREELDWSGSRSKLGIIFVFALFFYSLSELNPIFYLPAADLVLLFLFFCFWFCIQFFELPPFFLNIDLIKLIRFVDAISFKQL